MKVGGSISNKKILLQVLQTKTDHARGFMFRLKPPGDAEGLLFCFDEPNTHSFWMKNVFFDLDIMGFDENFRCVHIGSMTSMDERSHLVPYPTMYVVEVRAGWCADHKVKVGDLLVLD